MKRTILISLALAGTAIMVGGCNTHSTKKFTEGSPETYSKQVTSDGSHRLLGLPQVPIPVDNKITLEKVQLGNRLFHDKRFSKTGQVACANCHDSQKRFTDSPLEVSLGINDLKNTRNSPTVINAAYYETQFWDGRSPTLEDQSRHPFVNSVEMALPDHTPIIKTIQNDDEYVKAFKKVFNINKDKITIEYVTKAIATFERTLVVGNSRFDRWYFNRENTLSEDEIKGFKVFIGNGRCVSCHMVEHTTALFTDNLFHNIGVGINRVPQKDLDRLVEEFLRADYNREEVDEKVLSDKLSSELGRFAVTRRLQDIGAFKTSQLRNIEHTAPYMHDGSLKTLEDVVEHYNRGGASSDNEKINPLLSGGIKPLDLTSDEKKQLVAFMKSLTTPNIEITIEGENNEQQ